MGSARRSRGISGTLDAGEAEKSDDTKSTKENLHEEHEEKRMEDFGLALLLASLKVAKG